MSAIKIPINDDEHRILTEEHRKMCVNWLRTSNESAPPPFEQWLASRLMESVSSEATGKREVAELRLFNAIEKLITSLQKHGFGLAHLGKDGVSLSDSSAALAQALANDLALAHSRAKRIQELLEYYSKSPKEIADLARVTVTNRAYGALHEAYRELVERTEKALDHLGDDKALGRVEGGIAILVALHVMSRDAATEKTETFKALLHERKR